MAKSIIKRADEMVDKVGLEDAIKFYQERIRLANPSEGFSYICLVSACEAAIEHIKNKYKQ